MKRLLLVSTIMTLVFLFSISPTMASDTPGVSNDTILIGMPGWFTGPGAAYTVPIKQGVELAVKEVNESGGVNGRKIKLIIEDTGYSPKQALAVIRRLVEKDKVFCLVGANVTSTTWAMLPMITKYKIPLVETMASTTILTAPYNKYVFRTMVNHWYLAWLAVDYAVGHLKKSESPCLTFLIHGALRP